MDISKHIGSLLYEHDCVIVPGLGGFLTDYQPAQLHPTLHIFSPPSKSIAFNRNLQQSDGLLANCVSVEEDISYEAAAAQIEHFVENCLDQLNQREIVVLNGIGKLMHDFNDNLRFLPDKERNYLLESFGMASVRFTPIIRQEKVEEKIVTATLPVLEERIDETKKELEVEVVEAAIIPEEGETNEIDEPRKLYPLLRVAAILLIITAVTQIFVYDITFQDVKMTGLNLFSFSQPDVMEVEDDVLEATIIEVEEPTSLEQNANSIPDTENETVAENQSEELLEEVAETTITENFNEDHTTSEEESFEANFQPGYYAIVGSFQADENASMLASELSSKGYIVQQFSSPNGWKRVGVFMASSKSDALGELSTFRSQESEGAWLLNQRSL